MKNDIAIPTHWIGPDSSPRYRALLTLARVLFRLRVQTLRTSGPARHKIGT